MSDTSISQANTFTTLNSGYYCSCGQWVQHGIYHTCPNNLITTRGWMWPAVIQPRRFNGKLENIDDLPSGSVGDSYYIKHADVLVVRSSEGWVIVPRAED